MRWRWEVRGRPISVPIRTVGRIIRYDRRVNEIRQGSAECRGGPAGTPPRPCGGRWNCDEGPRLRLAGVRRTLEGAHIGRAAGVPGEGSAGPSAPLEGR